jgi:TRAP-type C4-dicarboxylate transport system permease small subunit
MNRPARWLAAVPPVVVTALMIIAMGNMLLGVFLRYVMTWLTLTFDLPTIRFYWVEEIGEFALAWMSFIGAAIGIQKGVHFSVQMLTERLPARLRQAVYTAHYVLIAAFGALIAGFGWRVAQANSLAASPALNINLRWLYLSSVAGGALMVLYSLATIRDGWRGRWPGHQVPEAE